MVFENGVKIIQAAAYNGARTVILNSESTNFLGQNDIQTRQWSSILLNECGILSHEVHSLNISKTTTNIERMVERDKWDKIPPPFDKIELRRLVCISFWPRKLRNYSIQELLKKIVCLLSCHVQIKCYFTTMF